MGGRKSDERNCIFCGEPIIGMDMHRECVIDDIYETLFNGQKLTQIQYARAKMKKINMKEPRMEVLEDMVGRTS